jgi:hypothetical protein
MRPILISRDLNIEHEEIYWKPLPKKRYHVPQYRLYEEIA